MGVQPPFLYSSMEMGRGTAGVTIMNKTPKRVKLSVYNYDDMVCWVPKTTRKLMPG